MMFILLVRMSNGKKYDEFTIEDVFNGRILEYCTQVDTTITFANGKKVELSLESYEKLMAEAK